MYEYHCECGKCDCRAMVFCAPMAPKICRRCVAGDHAPDVSPHADDAKASFAQFFLMIALTLAIGFGVICLAHEFGQIFGWDR